MKKSKVVRVLEEMSVELSDRVNMPVTTLGDSNKITQALLRLDVLTGAIKIIKGKSTS